MILNDPALIEAAGVMVTRDLVNAEWAVAEKAEELAAQFREIDDPYLKERGRDVEQVTSRLLKALAGSRLEVRRPDPGEPLIFVAHDITPADMLQLKGARGFLIELGGSNAHAAILARSLQIASVVGATSASKLIRDEDMLILDGDTGTVIVNPDEFVLNEYRERQQLAKLEAQKLARLINVPSTTLDGQTILLMANIEQPEEALEAMRLGAAGIGLFRSEFLFLNKSRLPGEDEQYEAYAAAITAMEGRPVTIRTIDIGADKTLAGQEFTQHGRVGARAARHPLQPGRARHFPHPVARAPARFDPRTAADPVADALALPGDRRLTDPDRAGPRAAAPAGGEGRVRGAGRRHDRSAGGGAVGRLVRAAP